MTLRSPAVLMLALVAVLAGLVVAVDLTVAPPVEETGAVGEATEPATMVGGAWACPVGDTRGGTDLTVTAVAPDLGDGATGRVQLGVFGDGELDLGAPTRVEPGSSVRGEPGGEETAAFARWDGHPVALWRTWRLSGEEDLPPGRVAGPCLAEDSDRWWIPGMSTAGGHESRVRLANPYESDATVAVRLLTPEGPVEPTVLQNLTVLGRSTTEIEINEHLPERDDVAVDVQVIAGRVAAEGYQLVRQAIGDVDATSLLASATRPSATWTVPWLDGADDRHSWLWLLNPGDRPAPVELTFHDGDGGVAPEGLAEVTVEPGQLRRIDLRGTFPEDMRSAALTARADGQPVVVSGVVRLEADEPTDAAVPVQLGAQPSGSWLVAGGATQGRTEQLRLINPGGEAVVVDVTLWDGEQALRPDDLQGLEVAPGALERVDLVEELGEVDEWVVQVDARDQGQLVVGHVGHGGEEARELVAGVGASAAAWAPEGPAVPARPEAGLTQRLGTGLAEPPLAEEDDLPVPPDSEDD